MKTNIDELAITRNVNQLTLNGESNMSINIADLATADVINLDEIEAANIKGGLSLAETVGGVFALTGAIVTPIEEGIVEALAAVDEFIAGL